MRRVGWAAVFVVLGFAGAPPSRAVEGASLPAFELLDLDGQTVGSSALAVPGRSLVLYLSPNAAGSHALLGSLRAEDPLSRVAVIVGGSKEEAQALVRSVPELAGARFFADPGRSAFAALSLHGVPATMGLRDGKLAWTWLGAEEDAAAVRSRLVGWLR
jgi:hypothetical protein